ICGRETSMAETVEVKPLGRTIVVSTFASELFDIATLLERCERTHQMHQRAGTVEYRQSRGHHDDAEQGCLTHKVAAGFVLKIILADRTEGLPAGTEATAAAVRN